MVKTVNVTIEVTPDHEVRISLPDDVPVGPAQITLIVVPTGGSAVHTVGELADLPFWEIWRDRDIADDPNATIPDVT